MTRYRFTFVLIFWVFLFLLYALTAPPSISELFSDSLEFQLVAPTFAITHPTGYPLYTLLGGIWSRFIFPFGNWAWRMNLFSALAGATAVTFLALLAQRLHPDRTRNQQFAIPWAALVFALIPVWWQQSTIAEVYALHLCFVGAILLAVIEKEERGGGGERETMRLGETTNPQLATRNSQFLLLGLSLTHHRTAILLIPGILLYWLMTQPAIFRPQRAWFRWGAALCVPLLLYAYLPIRAAMGARDLRGDYTNSLDGFIRHALASGYTGFLTSNPLAQERSLTDWLALFQQQLGTWVLIFALFGFLLILWKLRSGQLTKSSLAAWYLIAFILVANLIFAVNYQVADVEVFLLPVFFCIALFFEAGIKGLLSLLQRQRIAQRLLATALFVVILYPVDWRSALMRAGDWSIHDYAVAMAKTPFPPSSHVIGLEGEMSALRYMQLAESLGLDAQPIVADSDAARQKAIGESLAAGDPTFITREVPDIAALYDFSAEGVLVRLWRKGEMQLAPLPHPLDVDLMDGALTLVGFDLYQLDRAGGVAWQLTIDWLPKRQIAQSLKLSLRWLDGTGETLLWPDGRQGEDLFPLRQVFPTTVWRVDETVRDVQIVQLPAQLVGRATTLQVIVYDSATGAEVGRWQVDLPK